MPVYRVMKSDIELALKVVQLFFRRGVTKHDVNTFLSGEDNFLLIYLDNDKIAGFAYGYKLQRFDGTKSMMYMHQVEVLPEFRKLGIGKKLMDDFIEICKANDCSKLFLITNKSNEPAVALYNSVGGKTLHEDDIVYTFPV